MNALQKFLYLIAAPFFGISFILLPLTNDARIYIGVARLTDYFGSFPSSLDLAWEIKPLMNRLIAYILYHIGILFGNDLMPYVARAVALLCVVMVAWYFHRNVKGQYNSLLIYFAFTTTANFCMLQAEFWAVLLSFLCFAMLMSKNEIVNYLSGPMMLAIFLCKGITGALLVPIWMAVILLRYDSAKVQGRFILSTIASFAVYFFILCPLWFPHSIADMELSSHLARVGLYPITTLLSWMFMLLSYVWLYIPVLIMGTIAAVYMLWKYWHKIELIPYIIMWLSMFAAMVLQGEFFVYHYMMLVFPAVITILLAEEALR